MHLKTEEKPRMVAYMSLKLSIYTSNKTQNFSITKIILLTLMGEIIADYYTNLMKPINEICGQDMQLMTVKVGGMYSNHWSGLVCSVKMETILFFGTLVTTCVVSRPTRQQLT
jgi:hypothetical protein